jgi:hypothetical protein
MSFSIIASGGAQSPNGTYVVSPALNCIGAGLIIIAVCFSRGQTVSVADSLGNPYSLGYEVADAFGIPILQFLFTNAVVVGAAMTFLASSSSGPANPSIAVMALSAFGAVDLDSGQNQYTMSPITTGAISPVPATDFVVSAISMESGPAPTPGIGALAYSAAAAANAWGIGMSYQNPAPSTTYESWEWTGGSTVHCQTGIVSFSLSSSPVTGKSLKQKLFSQASVFAPLQALLGTNPFNWYDEQLDMNALASGKAAIVVRQLPRRPMWANLGQLPTSFTRVQFTIYGGVPDINAGADSQNCDAVVTAMQAFMPTFNATGIVSVPARGNQLVLDMDGGLTDDAETQPRTFKRILDYIIFSNDNS